ncbi:MAG: LptA/OstA family protein [Candidatus Margulisiibacteriota bacterium]|nr:LptA/OstA family protein [Candidatus Margulisiibacteriota bacterium]
MKLSYRILLIAFLVFITGIFYWAIFSPKEDISERIQKTLKEQGKRADLTFKDVSFEEVVAGVKYWKLTAKDAMVNKSTDIATLRDSKGTFYKKGEAVLRFISPAALWDMKKKEIYMDKPLGYDVKLESKISSLLRKIKKSNQSIFNLPALYKKGPGYWFKAKNCSWKFNDQKLLCTGGIVVNKGEVTGYSENLQADVALENIFLKGDPKIIIKPKNSSPITVEAKIFEVISSQDIIVARGSPKVFWGSAEIVSTNIKYLQRDKLLELSGWAQVKYKDIRAWGKSAKYYSKEQKIVLEGDAGAVQADNRLSGKKVQVSFKDQKISVLGRGKAVFSD